MPTQWPPEALAFGWAITGFLGLVFGSFATALVWRIPREIPWIFEKDGAARSRCMACGRQLTVRDLVPLFSWIFSKGKCRFCGTRIGLLYPLIEMATLAGCLGVYAAYGLSAQGAVIVLAVPFLVALLAIDLEFKLLPDELVAIVGGLGMICVLILARDEGDLQVVGWRIAAALLYGALAWGLGGIMTAILKKEALGFGDVKFFAVAGLWLGAGALPAFLLISGLTGMGLGILWKVVTKEAEFPFGPALILSVYAILISVRLNVSVGDFY